MEVNATVSAEVSVHAYDVLGYVGKTSSGDFTTAYASATAITVGTLPDSSTLTAEDVLTVVQFDSSGNVVAIFDRNSNAMTMVGSDLTITGATFSATDTFAIYTNIRATSATSSSVEVTNGAGALAVNIQDGGNSITVDGTVTVQDGGSSISIDDNGGSITVDGTITANIGTTNGLALDATLTGGTQKTRITDGTDDVLVTPSGELQVLATAQPGTDIGDVTINNAAGASAVNIQDGGNSITVDGAVAATQSGTWDIGTLTSITNVVHIDDNAGSITVDGTVAISGSVAITNAALGVVGGGLEATALRVTIANDSTGVLSIDDNGGSITVDGTVAVSGTVTVSATDLDIRNLSASQDTVGVHGSVGLIDQFNLTTTNPIATAIVDANGDQITSFGGGVQYTEGDTDASITGTAMMMEGAANALVPVQGTAADGLLVNLGTNNDVTVTGTVTVGDGGSSLSIDDNGGSITVDGTITANIGTTNGLALDATLTGGTQKTRITDGTDDALVTPTGELQVLATAQPGVDIGDVTINNAAGASAVNIQDGGNSITVDGAVAATQSGTWDIGTVTTITNVVHIDDNASSITVDGTVAISGSVDTELPSAAALADATANPTTTNLGAELMLYNNSTWDRARSGVTTPSSTFTGMLNDLPWAKYDTTPTARTNGQGGPLQADVNGALNINSYTLLSGEDQTNLGLAVFQKPVAASTYAPSRYVNLGSSTAANVKSSAGNVFSISITNANAASRYVQIHNTAGTPAGAAVPVYTFLIPAGGMVVIGNDFFTNAGGYLSTGIGFAVSTTAGTYTAATAADHMTIIHYI